MTRARIQAFSAAGYSEREIASKVGCSRLTVQLWKGKKIVKDKIKPRKSVKLSPSTKRTIKAQMYQKIGSSVRKCARRLNFSKRYRKKKKTISKDTVQKYLKRTKWGRRAYRRPTRPLLTEKNIKDLMKLGELVREQGYLDSGRLGQEKRSGILFRRILD